MLRTLIVVFLAFLGTLSASHADSLKQLEQTKAYRKVLNTKQKKLPSLYSEKWFSRATWYGRVFLDDEGASLLFAWLGTDAKKAQQRAYTGGLLSVKKEVEGIVVSREFVTPNFKQLVVTIVVPHPRSAVACGAGLVPICNVVTTPKEKRFSETSVVREYGPSEYIKTTDNECVYLTHLPKNGLLQIKNDLCSSEAELKEFFDSLDIETLTKRLNS